jgi:hypothetical protein
MKMYEKESIGLKLVDEIYNDMIEGSNLSADNQKVELFLRGFKPISHKGIFAILKKKYGKNEGCSFELTDCEIVLTHVTLPNDRSGLPHKFPPLKIKIHSTINHVKFDLCGESAVLFVLFYLKTILQSFLKQLPEQIEQCYTSPTDGKENPVASEDESSGSHSVESPLAKSCSESEKSPSPIFHNRKRPDFNIIESVNEVEKSPSPREKRTTEPSLSPALSRSTPPLLSTPPGPVPSPTPTSPPSRSPLSLQTTPSRSISQVQETPSRPANVHASKPPSPSMQEAAINDGENKVDCMICALNRISTNIDQIVKENIMLCWKCSLECLECRDPLQNFVNNLCEIICKDNLLEFDSMEIFKGNIKNIIEKIVSKMFLGAPALYCKLLKSLNCVVQADKDRLAVVSRTILSFCLTEEFVNVFKEDKEARRRLFEYLGSTGSCFAFMSVIESLYFMFTKKVDLKKVLPSNLQHIIEIFQTAPSIRDEFEYHDFVSEVSRNIIKTVYKNELIDYFEISKKTFKFDDESMEIASDDFVYIDKLNSRLFHFLDLGDSHYAEPILFKNLIFSEDLLKVSSKRWDFQFENESIFQSLNMKKGEPAKVETARENEENTSDDLSDQQDSNDCGSESQYKPLQVVHTAITILRDDVIQYWDSRPNVKRKFLPGICGVNWPLLYNSPCVVVMGYNNAQVPGSQKRSCNFAKIKGKCKVCEASHIFEVEENPFQEELMDDNAIRYTAVKDLHIDVTVIGRFHDKQEDHPEDPDITRPIHDLKKAAGHHLKGKERQLIANRASKIGVKATYLEQLDYANEDQIRQGNKTSVKSIPVIKVARREQEKKQEGGNTFYESVLNVFETQHSSLSPNFEETAISKRFPGFIREALKIKNSKV